VLPVFAFIAFWVVVGASAVFIGMRSGASHAPDRGRRGSVGGRRFAVLAFAVLYLGFGILIPIGFLTGNHANANEQIGGIKLTAAEKTGRELFGEHCAVCHTLAAANAVGKVGPNLDVLKPPAALVLNTINNGCLQKPRTTKDPENCLGQGTMPADIIQGQPANKVAQFVGKVAGKE
jgi:mono/diheme cytochrome c family protein